MTDLTADVLTVLCCLTDLAADVLTVLCCLTDRAANVRTVSLSNAPSASAQIIVVEAAGSVCSNNNFHLVTNRTHARTQYVKDRRVGQHR